MSLRNACILAGYNGGTFDCDPTPGVLKYLLKWEGKLPVSDLVQGDSVCEATLIAHSKLGKVAANKLVVFPLVRDPQDKKEANTEVKLADGFTEVTREGLPAWELKVNLTMYLSTQLRKGNNKRTRYAFVDDKNQLLACFDSDGNVVGRAGKFFTNGLDAKGYDKTSGESMVLVQAENPYETFDVPAVVQLSAAPPFLFKSLKDIYLYNKATATHAAGTVATGGFTVTAVGADGDFINVLYNGVSISGGPVEKTASESTVTLLAAKIAAAITAATNGGITAANTAGAILITTPKSTAFNTTSVTVDITGTATIGAITAFTGAVDTNTTIKVSGRMKSPIATLELDFYSGTGDLDGYGASPLGTDKTLWTITALDGTAKTVTSVAPNAAGYFDLVSNALPLGTYRINGVAPEILDAALVKAIELNEYLFTKS